MKISEDRHAQIIQDAIESADVAVKKKPSQSVLGDETPLDLRGDLNTYGEKERTTTIGAAEIFASAVMRFGTGRNKRISSATSPSPLEVSTDTYTATGEEDLNGGVGMNDDRDCNMFRRRTRTASRAPSVSTTLRPSEYIRSRESDCPSVPMDSVRSLIIQAKD